MKERRLKIIISIMTISVIGLIALQFYWMGNVLKVEETLFRRAVFRSLRAVVENIEKNEAATTLVKKATGGKGNVIFFFEDNSNNKNKVLNLAAIKKISYVRIDTANREFNYEVKYFTDKDSLRDRIKVLPENIPGPRFSFPLSNTAVLAADSTVRKRYLLVQNVMTELMAMNAQKKIEDRINAANLEKSLTKELQNNGITADFYFGVKVAGKDSLTLVKEGTDITELKKSIMRINLFPSEFFYDQNQLILYFPHQKSYILATISGMLILSVGLILVIVGVFYKTVQMFISQKKITAVKNDLINNITHEFKTPISTISLACEALNEPGMLTKKNSITRYSKIIKDENERLKMMVDALLNTAALEKSEFDFNKEEINLHEIIELSATKFRDTIDKKSGKITFDFDVSNPVIKGDKFHLTNILINLIDNAIKYNERKPEIIIATKEINNSILISVKDNGIGIAKEHVSKIFETFFRVANGNVQNVRGNGIGLSYAQKIVEGLGGKISVLSEPGIGSEFQLILPRNGNK